MGNVVIAINALIALTELVGNISRELHAVGALIQKAHAEGRDLTDAELAQVAQARTQAVAAWNALDKDNSGSAGKASQ